MTLDDLEESLGEFLPSTFRIRVDGNGQVIIYTGLTQDNDGELSDFENEDEEEEDEEEDDDIDPDFEPLSDDDDD